MTWRGWPALALALVLAPLAPQADATRACGPHDGLLAAPTRVLQDDADSGRDAPDARAQALALPPGEPTPHGSLDAYYWAWLDPPLGAPGADGADWYAAHVVDVDATLMINITSNYTARDPMGYYAEFSLAVYAPGAHAPTATTTSAGPTLHFADPQPGVWLLLASTLQGEGCAQGLGDAPPDASNAQRNHGLYVGCHPFCLQRGLASK